MALPSVTEIKTPFSGVVRKMMHEATRPTNWITIHNDATVADNGGSEVVAPNALSSASHNRLDVTGGNYIHVRARYNAGASLTTDPEIQVFGFDSDGVPERLAEASGDFSPVLADASTDPSDGTYEYTDGKVFDLRANRYVLVAIKVAAVASAGPVVVQARLI